MRVLIVDDFATVRRIIRTILVSQYVAAADEIKEAENGHDALRVLQSFDPDLIISDWNMPRMTGIDFLRAVRKLDGAKSKIPVLMVTAEAKRENIVEAAQAGVNGYVIKPFTGETLIKKIDQIFARLDERAKL
jgi:two-component system chemotaxis response regulator CheY